MFRPKRVLVTRSRPRKRARASSTIMSSTAPNFQPPTTDQPGCAVMDGGTSSKWGSAVRSPRPRQPPKSEMPGRSKSLAASPQTPWAP